MSVSITPASEAGEFMALRKRRITEDTCRKFGVRVDGRNLRYPYYKGNEQVAWKIRKPDKEHPWEGRPCPGLFGQQLWPSGGKCIVITEGEIDAMTFAQVRPGWPVVSVPNGADGAAKAIKRELQWLDGYEQVILCFDDDEPGRAAAQECAPLLRPDQAFISKVDKYKDANEALMEGDEKAIMSAIWNAQKYIPQSIIRANDPDLLKRIVEWDCEPAAHWHHPRLDEVLRGLQLGRVYTLAADTGVGKSTFLAELAHSLLEQKKTLGWMALEEDDVETAMRLMTIKANTPADMIEDRAERLRLAQEAVTHENLFLTSRFASNDPDTLLRELAYLVKGEGCQFLILDHLSILLSDSEERDERRLIDRVMTKLKDFVKRTNACLIQVVHINTSESGRLTLNNLRGSRSIGQLSDAVVVIERDTREGEDEAQLVVLKNRPNRGRTGKAGMIQYNPLTGRQLPYDPPPGEEEEEDRPRRSGRRSRRSQASSGGSLEDPLPDDPGAQF
jgi:twinkle protein